MSAPISPFIDPSNNVAAETLKGGLGVTIRALRCDDRESVVRAVRGLDRQSIYFRLLGYLIELIESGRDRVITFDPDREVASS